MASSRLADHIDEKVAKPMYIIPAAAGWRRCSYYINQPWLAHADCCRSSSARGTGGGAQNDTRLPVKEAPHTLWRRHGFQDLPPSNPSLGRRKHE